MSPGAAAVHDKCPREASVVSLPVHAVDICSAVRRENEPGHTYLSTYLLVLPSYRATELPPANMTTKYTETTSYLRYLSMRKYMYLLVFQLDARNVNYVIMPGKPVVSRF